MLRITPWERSALELLATGTDTNDMAARFGLTEREIQQRLSVLYERMGAASPADAIAAALRRGLLVVQR